MLSVKEVGHLEKALTVKAQASLDRLLKDTVDHHISVNTVVVIR